ncbi:MAG: hypothetical protein R8G66_23945 [Cytophagales bacterium]|nr:hypothetical protein [Cytophagales bacterium]
MDIKLTLTILIPSIISFIGGYLLFRLKSSLVRLQKRVSIQRLASSNDDFWGDISIQYNKQKINHLQSVHIEIFNNTGKDVDDFILTILSPDNSRILSSFATNTDTHVELEDSFLFQEQKEAKNWGYLDTTREYSVQVLNRRTELSISLLLESTDQNLDDNFIVSIEKKGVVIKPYKKPTSDLGFILTGFIVVILTAFFTYLAYPESLIPIAIVASVGSLHIWIGLIIYYTIMGWKHYEDED